MTIVKTVVAIDRVLDSTGRLAHVLYPIDGFGRCNYKHGPYSLTEVRAGISMETDVDGEIVNTGYLTWLPVFTEWFV